MSNPYYITGVRDADKHQTVPTVLLGLPRQLRNYWQGVIKGKQNDNDTTPNQTTDNMNQHIDNAGKAVSAFIAALVGIILSIRSQSAPPDNVVTMDSAPAKPAAKPAAKADAPATDDAAAKKAAQAANLQKAREAAAAKKAEAAAAAAAESDDDGLGLLGGDDDGGDAEPEFTLETLRALGMKLVQAKQVAKFKEILANQGKGAENLTELGEDLYPAVGAALTKATAKL